jgi:enoyl-CoA hydratase/carnithine racemase
MSEATDLQLTNKDAVRCLTLNRPQSRNGLTIELCGAIVDALKDAGSDPSVRAVMITGAGDSFCSGLDLKAAVAMVQGMQQGGGSVDSNHLRDYFHGMIRAVRAVDKPVVALLDGMAAGFGCDLALACDMRLGTSRAAFAELFVKRGLMPDGGGTYSLPRLVGVGKALELMFLGEKVTAEEALRLGLLNRILPSADAAFEIMAQLAAGPPLVLSAIKRGVYGALAGDLESALEFECEEQMKLLRTADCAEGMTAFFNKRPPQFTGK